MLDLKPLFENLSGQTIILLSIVALVLIVTGIMTQGFGRTIAAVIGVLVLIALILMLAYAKEIGQWIVDKVFKPNAGMISPMRGGARLWNTITHESLNSLSKFIR
ncbi:hypothetical protein SHT67_14285 (plasmid) [Enterococcus faecalis]|uniref:hypothetical protein n=1 Tax=Enterococcus faecalis TaxID=1351 RepID=UPI0029C7C59B|nr:hypothetical protein [Enterococcus faecalis]WPH48343.1 hypothetical protein SHT67_14285 [Enterococcus faecalis]